MSLSSNSLPFSAIDDVLGGATCLTGLDGCLDIIIVLILPLGNLASCSCFTTSFAWSGEDKLRYEAEKYGRKSDELHVINDVMR